MSIKFGFHKVTDFVRNRVGTFTMIRFGIGFELYVKFFIGVTTEFTIKKFFAGG